MPTMSLEHGAGEEVHRNKIDDLIPTFRGWAIHLVSRPWFDTAVVFLILCTCVFLALDDPTVESQPRWQEVADTIFTSIFTLEMLLKLAAFGLQYFTDGWNMLDAVVVLESLFSSFFHGGVNVKSFRVLRVLRPLRTVRRMPRVQLVVTSLLRSGWTLGRIVCIFVVWLTIFALMGVLLWSGTLTKRCSSPTLAAENVVGGVCGLRDHFGGLSPFCASLELLNTPYICENGQTCEEYGSSPYSGMVNFNNLMWSLLTLFTVTTLEGWHEVLMFTQRVMSEYTIWFFVFLIVTATWAIMSLMIAAMLARFKAVSLAENLRLMEERANARAARELRAREMENLKYTRGGATFTLARGAQGVQEVVAKTSAGVGGAIARGGGVIARGGVDMLNAGSNLATGFITAHAESKPEGKTARLIHTVAEISTRVVGCVRHLRIEEAVLSEESAFSQVIHWAIITNVVVIGMGGYNIGGKKAAVLSELEAALAITFTTEAALKITVLGARRYFKSRWNRFDFFTSMSALSDLIVTTIVHDVSITASLRLLNVLRVFRILRMRRLKRTVMTVVGVITKSARDLWPVVALMLLMCFVFTVLGMQLFGATLDPGREEFAKYAYASTTRFDTFFWSFVQVFTVIAGDSWNTIMYVVMENTTPISSLFFVVIIVLGKFVLLNLVLAIVLEGASDQMKEKHAAQQFRDKTLRLFHNQYKRLAIRRWNAKLRAEAMLERGHVLVLPGNMAEKLGLLDFPRPMLYQQDKPSSRSSSTPSLVDVTAYLASRQSSSPSLRQGGVSSSSAARQEVDPLQMSRRQSDAMFSNRIASLKFLGAAARLLVTLKDAAGFNGRQGATDQTEGTTPREEKRSVTPDASNAGTISHEGSRAGDGRCIRGAGKSPGGSHSPSSKAQNSLTQAKHEGRLRTSKEPEGATATHGASGDETGAGVAAAERLLIPSDQFNSAWGKTWRRDQLKVLSTATLAGGGGHFGDGSLRNEERSRQRLQYLRGMLADRGSRPGVDDDDDPSPPSLQIPSVDDHQRGKDPMTAPSPGDNNIYGGVEEGGGSADGGIGLRYADVAGQVEIGRDEGQRNMMASTEGAVYRWERSGGQGQDFRNPRDAAIEGIPKALYGIFSEMIMKRDTPKWWYMLDRILGARVDKATWVRWHLRKSPARQWCSGIVAARQFETVMVGFIIASVSVSLLQTDDLSSLAGVLDTICLAAFCVELCLRAAVHSWWIAPSAVLRNPWILLDLYLVVCHGSATMATALGLEAMSRSKKVLKSARPLRLIHHVKSLQEMAEALVHSLKSCGTLLVLIATLLFGYSMVGVEVLGGMLYSCSDPEFPPKMSRHGEFDADAGVWISPPCTGDWVNPETGLLETRDFEWTNYVYHFNTIGPALLSALIVTTLDGWVDIYHRAADAYMVDHQPAENCNLNIFWYFFGGIIVFGFYITNLFVGVMFEAFLSYKNVNSTGGLISQAERRWRDYERRLCQVVPIVAPCRCTDRPWRARVQRLVLDKRFSNFVVSVLVVNAFVLAADHASAPDWQLAVQNIFNNVFASIFVVETCLMLYGLGARCYFSTGRQVFDFVVTAASLVDLVMEVSGACAGHDIIVLKLVRSLRVVRVIRLATHIPGFDQILAACSYPARVLLNVFVLLAIGVYVFANIGFALFSDVVVEKTTINLYQDFSSVWRAMQLLFIVATGEAWSEYASKVAAGGDQPLYVVFAFFVIFVMMMQFILTNLFIMVIVETFETLNALERQDLEDAVPCFQQTWTTFDPKGSGRIPPKHLFTFLLQLDKPLGAEGNHALAGRYAAMLKSTPAFDFTFTKVLVGLGAALLSDEKHAHAKAGGYRPMKVKQLMATLVVQRALKRNMMQKAGRWNFADIVLAADATNRLGSSAHQFLSDNSAPGFRVSNGPGGTGRLSSTGRLSATGRAGLEGWQLQQQQQQWQEQQQEHHEQQKRESERGRMGSIILPPDDGESKWLMRRFLVDLQRNYYRDDEDGGGIHSVNRGRPSRRRSNSNGGSVASLQPWELFRNGSSEGGIEIGPPARRDSDRENDRPSDDGGIEEGINCDHDDRGYGEEEKSDEVPTSSLAKWLRERESTDLRWNNMYLRHS